MRYAILYFLLFVVFLALVIGPIVAAPILNNLATSVPQHLYQPINQNNNDTGRPATGTGAATASATTTSALKMALV